MRIDNPNENIQQTDRVLGTKPLLPRLKTDREIKPFKNAGAWDKREEIELNSLSKSLDLDQVGKIDVKNLSCIPDMWARPLLFEIALYSDDKSLKEPILAEWRGLMALLAFSEWRNLQIKAIPINFAENIDDTEFAEALRQLLPSKTLADDTTWERIYVITINDRAIGIASPSTLICTAVDYEGLIDKTSVNWFDGKMFIDPIEKLSPEEKSALLFWLNNLQQSLSSHNAFRTGISNEMIRLINDFINELIGKGATGNRNFKLSNLSLGMTEGIFKFLDQPIEPIEQPSWVQLKPSQGLQPSMKILVVDERIPQVWGVPAQNVVVHRNITIKTFPFDNLQPNKIGDRPLPSGFEIKKADQFFTEKLFVIEQKDAFPGTSIPKDSDLLLDQSDRPITPIIPIEPELLNYMKSDELHQRIRFIKDKSGISVRLRLQLLGPDGRGKDFETQKFFSFEKDIVPIPNVPVLEIWPNFKEQDWQIYFTFFFTQSRGFYAEPYVTNEEPISQIFKTVSSAYVDSIERQITQTKSFPDAFKCKANIVDAQTNETRSIGAGILLVKLPETVINKQPNKIWKVGVDFGTTNTNVHINDGVNTPHALQFEKHFMQVTSPGDVARSTIYDWFLPGREEKTPILSFYHNFQKAEKYPLRPLVDGCIQFIENYKGFRAEKQGLMSDLKWSEEQESRFYVRAFLEQLCLQCSAEAICDGVSKISWRFSYPTAFSQSDLQGFHEIWALAAKKSLDLTQIAHVEDKPKEEPESISSAKYFAFKYNAPFGPGSVCIDIGGGTSDISIWQDNDLRMQTSLRIAGREMFLNLLYENPDFLRILQVDDSTVNGLRQSKEKSQTKFYAQADVLLANEGKKWMENLPAFAGNQKVKEFMQIIALGISGLYYYIGLAVKYLQKSERYQAQIPNLYIAGNGSRMLYWLADGNYGKQSRINDLFKFVLTKASGFITDPNMINVIVTNEPKAESAFGLVCDREFMKHDGMLLFSIGEENQVTLDNHQIPSDIESKLKLMGIQISPNTAVISRNQGREWLLDDGSMTRFSVINETSKLNVYGVVDEILAGEAFIENGISKDWDETLTRDRLKNGLKTQQKLICLEDFLDAFNIYANSPGSVILPLDVDSAFMNRVNLQLLQTLGEYKLKDSKGIHVEPLFIIGLKALLKEKTNDWANHQ